MYQKKSCKPWPTLFSSKRFPSSKICLHTCLTKFQAKLCIDPCNSTVISGHYRLAEQGTQQYHGLMKKILIIHVNELWFSWPCHENDFLHKISLIFHEPTTLLNILSVMSQDTRYDPWTRTLNFAGDFRHYLALSTRVGFLGLIQFVTFDMIAVS